MHGVAYHIQVKNQGIIAITGGTSRHVYPTEVLIIYTNLVECVYYSKCFLLFCERKKAEIERPKKFVLFFIAQINTIANIIIPFGVLAVGQCFLSIFLGNKGRSISGLLRA